MFKALLGGSGKAGLARLLTLKREQTIQVIKYSERRSVTENTGLNTPRQASYFSSISNTSKLWIHLMQMITTLYVALIIILTVCLYIIPFNLHGFIMDSLGGFCFVWPHPWHMEVTMD